MLDTEATEDMICCDKNSQYYKKSDLSTGGSFWYVNLMNRLDDLKNIEKMDCTDIDSDDSINEFINDGPMDYTTNSGNNFLPKKHKRLRKLSSFNKTNQNILDEDEDCSCSNNRNPGKMVNENHDTHPPKRSKRQRVVIDSDSD